MLQDIWVLLIEAEEAIQKLVSVKARITAKLARQVAEAPGKTIRAKKRKVLSGLDQEERKTVTDLDQHFREKIFGDPEKPQTKEEGTRARHRGRGTQGRSPCSDDQASEGDGPGTNPGTN